MLRANPIKKFGEFNVVSIKDYSISKELNINDNKENELNLPISNVLYYELENNEWCCIRPSGTEPKLKFYIGVKGKSEQDANERMNKLKEELLKTIK